MLCELKHKGLQNQGLDRNTIYIKAVDMLQTQLLTIAHSSFLLYAEKEKKEKAVVWQGIKKVAHSWKGDIDAEMLFYYRGREKERKFLACVSRDLKVHYTGKLPFLSAEVNKAMLEALY